MATANKLWTDVSTWTATVGAHSTSATDTTDWSGDTAIKFTTSGKNRSDVNFIEISGTWESIFGIPAGSTVTLIGTPDDNDAQCTAFSTAAASTAGPLELRDSGGTLLLTLSAGQSYSATFARRTQSGTQQSVPSAQQPSSTTIRFRLSATMKTGNSNSASNALVLGHVNVTITYFFPRPDDEFTVGIAQFLGQRVIRRATRGIAPDDAFAKAAAVTLAGSDAPFTTVTAEQSVLAWPGNAGGATSNFGFQTDDPYILNLLRTVVRFRPVPIDYDSTAVPAVAAALPAGDEFKTIRWSPPLVRPKQNDYDTMWANMSGFQTDDPWYQRRRWNTQVIVAPSDRDSLLGGLFVMQLPDDPFQKVSSEPSVWIGLGTSNGATSVFGFQVDDPFIQLRRRNTAIRLAQTDRDSPMSSALVAVADDGFKYLQRIVNLVKPRFVAPDNDTFIPVLGADDSPLLIPQTTFVYVPDSLLVGSDVPGGLFIMQPVDDPWYQRQRWNTSVRPAQTDRDSPITQPPIVLDDEFKQLRRWNTHIIIAQVDRDSVQGSLFKMQSLDDEWLKRTRFNTSIRIVPSDKDSPIIVGPMQIEDVFKQLRRWNTSVRAAQVDKDTLQGSLFRMQPLDDEFKTIRWSPIVRPHQPLADLDALQGSLFIMQPLDDEFKTIRWSPIIRIRPSQIDLDSIQGNLFRMQPLDDVFTQLRRWNTSIRIAPSDIDSTFLPKQLGTDDPWIQHIRWNTRAIIAQMDLDAMLGGLIPPSIPACIQIVYIEPLLVLTKVLVKPLSIQTSLLKPLSVKVKLIICG